MTGCGLLVTEMDQASPLQKGTPINAAEDP